jgi:hypothetical protein
LSKTQKQNKTKNVSKTPPLGGLCTMSTVTAVVIVQRQGRQGLVWIEGTLFHVVRKFEGAWLRLSEDVVYFAPPPTCFFSFASKFASVARG